MLPVFADIITPIPPIGGSSGEVAAGFAVALVPTVIIEFVVIYLLARKYYHIAASFGRLAAAGTLPSVFTLILIYLGAGVLAASPPGYLLLEALVILVEALLILRLLPVLFKRSLMLSFSANLASIFIGFLMFAF